MKKVLFNILITLVIGFALFYVMLPPINLSAPDFWLFMFLLVCIYLVIAFSRSFKLENIIKNRLNRKKPIVLYVISGVILLILVINIVNTPLFRSKSYYNRISIDETSVFLDDVKEVDFNKIPLLDKDSSSKLGDRVMGTMTDLVSQFYVSDLYTQINYNDEIVRVTPLEYAGLIKCFTNRKEGVKGYITVNSVTGESKLVRLEKGMKYMPSAMFSEDLYRKVRFSYPTAILKEASFEIDNDGNPFWVIPTISYTGVGLKEEIEGVIIVDPVTGKCVKYNKENVPNWIDHVYPASLIIEQVNDWGKYKNGFLNSLFGQKGVVMTTTGYNYTVMNDDVYLYTGITSVSSDESNIGFILSNMRTKETKFYSVSGAEEYSAMASAEGAVQQMKYNSTFPLLINLNNKPTYLMSLKDNAGLVKMYAFVDVSDYQKVVVTDASEGIVKASENYLGEKVIIGEEKNKKITIKSINSAVIEGNTYYYIEDADNNYYKASLKVNNILPFIKNGDTIDIIFKEAAISEIVSIK